MLDKILFISLFIVCLSCQSEPAKVTSTLANDICSCYTPLLEVNEKIQSMMKNGKTNEAERMIKIAEEINAKGKKCTKKLINKYETENVLDAEKISSAIKVKCPEILNIVEEVLGS